MMSTFVTPSKTSPFKKDSIFEKTLILNQKRNKVKQSLLWGTLNICILSVILYDISNDCTNFEWYFQYVEFAAIIVLTLNIMYHMALCMYLQLTLNAPLVDLSSKTSANNTIVSPSNSWKMSVDSTPNYTMSSNSWIYSRNNSPNNQNTSSQQQNVTPPRIHQNVSGINVIEDEKSLNRYLKDYENFEKSNMTNYQVESPNLLSSFWSHPASKSNKDASPLLRRCQYQLATQTPSPPTTPIDTNNICSSHIYLPFRHLDCSCFPAFYYKHFPRPFLLCRASSSPKSDDKSSPNVQQSQNMEMWRRLNVNSVAIMQWNENLRMWISQTILERLIKEFAYIDEALNKHGLTDVTVGGVGLDRLRKTAQMVPILQFIPSLSVVIPFLELSTNQEYLVKRIKELSKGGCMSEFKWNGGSCYNGKEWDISLPTDSAIIMHLFATYLDTQLLPQPNKPDAKPFSGFHYIKSNEKLTTVNSTTLAIQEVSENPPHYRVIVSEESFEVVKGYNNLFHTILLFLYFVNKKEHGMLGMVNLGKSGINILWIINS